MPGRKTHISDVMTRVMRLSRTTPDDLVHELRQPAAQIAGYLTGAQFPQREFVEKLARCCGADPTILLMIWDDEKKRRHTSRPKSPLPATS